MFLIATSLLTSVRKLIQFEVRPRQNESYDEQIINNRTGPVYHRFIIPLLRYTCTQSKAGNGIICLIFPRGLNY